MSCLKNENTKISFFNKELLWLFIIFKLITVFLFLFFYYLAPDHPTFNIWNRHFTGKEIVDAIYIPFANWDAQHYLLLSYYGYYENNISSAFYPLYPFLIRIVNIVFNNIYLSAFVLTTILNYSFCYYFYKYSRHYLQKKEALWSLVLVLCFPAAFYMTAFYAEALFLFLLFGFLYYYEIKKSNLSLIFIFLLPLSRGQAVFVLAAMLLYVFIQLFKNKNIDIKKQYYNLVAFILGWISYFLFFYFATGDLFAGMKSQNNFIFENSIGNILNPFHFIEYLFSSIKVSQNAPLFNSFFSSYTNSLIDKIFVIASIVGLFFVYKSKKTLWIFLYFMLFYPVASMGNGGSFIRFSLLLAPILALALWKDYSNRKRILQLISFGFLCLQIYMIYRFSLNLWVS